MGDMKRELLTDIECMSGTGWYNEDIKAECPECGLDLGLLSYAKYIGCPDCKVKLKVKFGKQHYWKVEIND